MLRSKAPPERYRYAKPYRCPGCGGKVRPTPCPLCEARQREAICSSSTSELRTAAASSSSHHPGCHSRPQENAP